jgi:hypothetical protein
LLTTTYLYSWSRQLIEWEKADKLKAEQERAKAGGLLDKMLDKKS